MFTDLVDAAADLWLGASCAGCGRPGWGACEVCLASLGTPVRREVSGVPVWSCGRYDAPLSTLVPAWKDDAAWGLCRPFARACADLLVAVEVGDALLVPVPSSPSSVRARGYDHTRALTQGVARRADRRWEPVLRRRRRVRDQATLDRDARRRNQRGSVRAQPGQGRVVLVDDVVTTGATLETCLAALRDAGWTPVGALTIAATPLRSTRLPDSAMTNR